MYFLSVPITVHLGLVAQESCEISDSNLAGLHCQLEAMNTYKRSGQYLVNDLSRKPFALCVPASCPRLQGLPKGLLFAVILGGSASFGGRGANLSAPAFS